MIYLTIINALLVKQRMKNAFSENHIFTEYNLVMPTEILLYSIYLVDLFTTLGFLRSE